MSNRHPAPNIHDISKLSLPGYRQIKLDNGIPVYLIEMGTQKVLKVEVVFKAGRPYEHQQLVARATGRMLKEGTHLFSSADIAEQVDFYGATLSIPVSLDVSSIVLYTLSRHFEALLPLLQDMLTRPTFPEKELQTFIDNHIQTLQVELSKNDVIAYRTITESVFGANHPYGYNSSPEKYRALKRDDLQKHFKEHYHSGNCTIIISGQLEDNSLDLLNQYLGQSLTEKSSSLPYLPPVVTQPEKIKTFRPDGMQTAIRIGRRFHAKKHPDFHGFYILNTLLGGYFGSRLMSNIREEKGYTYNIFSTVDSLLYDSCFYIGTEVGNEFVEPAIREIYHEMERLQEELIEPGELKMLQNYLLGSMLSEVDGPFNVASIVKTIVLEELDPSDFDQLVAAVRAIQPEELQRLARKYLQKDDMWEIVVGEV